MDIVEELKELVRLSDETEPYDTLDDRKGRASKVTAYWEQFNKIKNEIERLQAIEEDMKSLQETVTDLQTEVCEKSSWNPDGSPLR